ncbi:zinc-ribbon and DUF3426 domain-containing protein [Piscinibacter sp.]|uniref:zinc-ribbon and DUF3426 domain-containing protein n=1 Tax=Piscinibacter sp. TaxID=1903157 RepID=UPI0039E34DB9
MSLATRCTSCGTVFRVVQDQLKVSEGWVRCGRCNEVFNALEGLFDLERDSPPEWSESKQMLPVPAPDEHDLEELPDPELVDKIDEQLFGSTARRTGFGALTGLGASDRGRGPDFADARFDTDLPLDALDGAEAAPERTVAAREPAAEADDAPAFVRAAEREARWQSSGTRKALFALALLLLGALALQGAHHFRDALAARVPAIAPALATWCGWAGCTIEAPRRIEDIVVESTALAKTASGDAFRFNVVLRNRAPTVAALPWIELTLTDASGELLARRTLGPQELHAPARQIGPGAETTLQAMLATGALRVTGYTVEIFYP